MTRYLILGKMFVFMIRIQQKYLIIKTSIFLIGYQVLTYTQTNKRASTFIHIIFTHIFALLFLCSASTKNHNKYFHQLLIKLCRPIVDKYTQQQNSVQPLKLFICYQSFTLQFDISYLTATRHLHTMPRSYRVQKIIAKREDPDNKTHYLIKWQKWPIESSTWQPIQNLQKCLEVVIDFQKDGPDLSDRGIIDAIPPPWSPKNKKNAKHKIKKGKKQPKDKGKEQVAQQEVIDIINTNLENSDEKKLIFKDQEQEEFPQHTPQKPTLKSFQQVQLKNDKIELAFEIIAMRRKRDDTQYEFQIKEPGKNKFWLGHWNLFKDYPRELCIFYQKNLKIVDEPDIQK